jgi:predicted nucleotidyltransferase
MNDLICQCRWPELPTKYDAALRSAVAYILERYDVSGIIASGTIVRGNPGPTSDLDIYVINRKPFRQRVQKFFHDIPAEIFVNPPQAVEDYFQDEQAARRPITAHILVTGQVILNQDPQIVDALREKAAKLLSQPPQAPKELVMPRYMAASLFEDAQDVAETDAATSQMILSQAVSDMLRFCFIERGQFIPRSKSMLQELEKIDLETARLARQFFETDEFNLRLEIAGKLANRTIQERGFFEWETQAEEIPAKQ